MPESNLTKKALAQTLKDLIHTQSFEKIGVNDTFGESGPGAELLHKYGLDAANIVATTKEFLA